MMVSSKKRIVFDTSFLINSLDMRSDLDAMIEHLVGPYKGYVPLPVIRELKRLPRDISVPALQLASRYALLLSKDSYADNFIIRQARAYGWILASDDLALSRAVRTYGIPVISHAGRKLRYTGPGRYASSLNLECV
jgi:rRNA-processing protein FCF1